MSVREITGCRGCGSSQLDSIIDLGSVPIINFGDKEETKAPLHLVKCSQCHLVQLKQTLDRDLLFKAGYYYTSGVTKTMREHLKTLVEDATDRLDCHPDSVWGKTFLDIGSNDGTLLDYCEGWTIGFDPSDKIWNPETEEDDKHVLINDYFTADRYWKEWNNPADVVFCIACFYSVDDPNKFLEDVKKVLAPDGLFVLQVNYLLSMLARNGIDDVVHEHVCYYSLKTLYSLCRRNGLEIEDAEFNEINGGSVRVYIRHAKDTDRIFGNKTRFRQAWIDEEPLHLETMKPYEEFASRVRENAYKLKSFVAIESAKNGKTFDVYGASTRGLTLLQLAGLDDGKLIRFAVDRDSAKVGKTYAGKIPVISEEQMRGNPPDYLLVLPHAYLPEFVQREKTILMSGASFVIPIPEPWKLQGGPV